MRKDIFKSIFFLLGLLAFNTGFAQKDCLTDAGTMSSTSTISLCADDCTDMLTHNGDETLDADDILQFVVHTGTNPAVPLARSSTPEFCFSQLTGGQYGVTYYISAIAGNNVGGNVSVTDPCYSQSVGTPVVWFETPIAFISDTEISVCGLETTLEATTPQSGLTGTWSATSPFFPTGGSTVHDPVMNAIAGGYGNNTFTWTVVNGPCTSTDQVLVHFQQIPNAYAGDDFPICGNMAELEAIMSVTGSTGQWTGNGSFNPATSPQTDVTAGTYGAVTFTWRESLGTCWSEDQVTVTFVQQPNPATIASFDTVCGNTGNINVLNVNGTGSWVAWYDGSLLNPAPIYNPGLNNASTSVTIGNYPIAELSRTVDFVWTETISGGGIQCIDSAEISLTFSREPVASVGAVNEAEVCGNSRQLGAVTVGSEWATGMWISTQFADPFDDPYLPDATVTIPVPGSYGDSAYVRCPFIWAMTNTGCTSLDTMWVTFYRRPFANAGLDNSVCGNDYELGAVFSLSETPDYSPYGIWSVYTGPAGESADIAIAQSDTTLVTVSEVGFWEFIFRENNENYSSCYSQDTVRIEFIEKPVIFAGEDKDVCGQITQMEGVDGGFNGTWLPNGISITDYSDPETMVTTNTYGSIDFIWLESNQFCSSKDTVTITFWRRPTANILTDEADSTVCGLTFENLRAENPGTGIEGIWYSINPATTYGDPFDVSTSATVPNYGYHDFYWIESTGPELLSGFCTDTAGPLRIHFIEVPDANAGGDTLFCGRSGYLNAIPSLGTGVWSTPSTSLVIIENQNDPTSYIESSVINTGNPTYPYFTLIWTEDNTNGCTDKDTMRVVFARVPSSEITIIPPKCFGEPATIAASEDSLHQYTWNFNGGIIDSISPVNSSGGVYEQFVYWANGDTIHEVSLVSNNYWGCDSPINVDTIPEPPIPSFDVTIISDTCSLGKGGIIFGDTLGSNAFFWIDPDVGPAPNTPVTALYNIPAGEYGIRTSYLTSNVTHYSYYISTFGTANCVDTVQYEIEPIGMIDAQIELSADVILEDLVAPNASVIFLNMSDYDDVSKRCEWHFGDGSIVKNCDPMVEHVYTEADCYEPFLIVMNRDLPECRDTAYLDACVKVDNASKLEIPNVFSPNGDGINDFFQVKAQTLRTFNGQILNRWGRVLYEWTNWEDFEAGWDGKINGGSKASPGVYFYIIKAEGMDGIPYDEHGALHLFSE